MAGAADLPKLPEGQESYAGIPKAVFVVSNLFNLIVNLLNFGIFYNHKSFPIK